MVDGSERSAKALIATTKLALEDLKKLQCSGHARSYDRLREMCLPVQYKGESLRKRTAQEKLGRMQKRIREGFR